jgi:hypothetical protein
MTGPRNGRSASLWGDRNVVLGQVATAALERPETSKLPETFKE